LRIQIRYHIAKLWHGHVDPDSTKHTSWGSGFGSGQFFIKTNPAQDKMLFRFLCFALHRQHEDKEKNNEKKRDTEE